jgi:gliding motility-associated-like protein
MLPDFSRIINCKYICVVFFAGLSVMLFGYKCRAQSLGDPIVRITFGSGINQYAGALKPDSGSTTYTPVNRSPEDNEYAIANSTQGMNRAWYVTTDHTGGGNGYMMVVNASLNKGLFYTRTVTGLCGGTTYQFAAWIKNILISPNGILPNITFTIEDMNGNELGGGNTNNIIATGTWNQYSFIFSTPANTQAVVLKMINNAPGGSGNDLAIDDITFRAYGSNVGAKFDQVNTVFCEGATQNIVMRATTPLAPGYAFKFQKLTSHGWDDLRPASTDPSITIATPTLAGNYDYRMVTADAGNIDVPSCVVSSNFLNIRVLYLPVAAIQVADEICQEPTVFKDASTDVDALITSWAWDFGDGTPISTERNPTHTYANPGPYTVKLTVKNDGGCESVTATKNIRVIPRVNTDFEYSLPSCETRAIVFTDKSISTEGNIISRTWDFGDTSAVLLRPDAAPFEHTFATGTYQVKLTIVTDKGCISTITKTIKISPLPDVNFILPEICFADQFAKFTDSTFIADNGALTYLWNFGDADATPGNSNTSTLQNPQHHYSRTDKYNVSLTVTSANGCAVTKTKTLQINGYPQPDFSVPNMAGLCANRQVLFVNKATASIGNITKIAWYFDYDHNSTTPDTIDNNPTPDKIYRHKFPAVLYPQASKDYKVRMIAYTGDAGVCQEFKEITVTVLASPIVTFTPPEIICLNNGPIKLSDFLKETTGIPGAQHFSGPGVTGDVFDPMVAGVGSFVIKCVYTATDVSACADSITRSITIKPIPTQVSAGPDVGILSGNSTTLRATATGNNLRYAWSPAIGLSDTTILNPVVTLKDDNVTYKLTVTIVDAVPNGTECFVQDSVKVTVLKVPEIPTAFTPNGDGINDIWEIKNLQPYDGATVNVFNRYGQKVYSSIGYNVPWNGQLNGGNLPIGVYYYIIDPKHGRKQVNGYVHIIR